VLDEISDQAACPFDKCQFLGKTRFEQHSDAMVASHVGGGNQRHSETNLDMMVAPERAVFIVTSFIQSARCTTVMTK
jgi:hypothetical protein